jgi:hypothetical protein
MCRVVCESLGNNIIDLVLAIKEFIILRRKQESGKYINENYIYYYIIILLL